MSSSKLAVRFLADNRNHHLWNNNGTWWCHYTVHLPDFTKQRVRLSLKTNDLGLAKRRRDKLILPAPNNCTSGRLALVRRLLLLLGAFTGLTLSSASAQPTTGQFQWPFAPREIYHKDQWHFEFNGIGNRKYHAGEDWNRGTGQDDYGDALYALADGVVEFVDKQGTSVPSIGRVLLLRYTLPDGSQLDDLRIHCADVLVNRYDHTGNSTEVSKGQKVATIGGNPSHLHWELHGDLSFWYYTNPYYETVTTDTAIKYLCPSLFVDDRANGQAFGLNLGWTYFQVAANSASSTAYLEDGQSRLSLRRAVNNGWVYSRVYVLIGGAWQYYNRVEDVFFEPGRQYAIYGYKPYTLNVSYPGHNFKADRARRDIIRVAYNDTRFRTAAVKTETYGENLAWDPSWELRHLSVSTSGKSVAFYQACNRQSPLVRFVGFIDPGTGTFSGWQPIDRNLLQ